MTPVLPPFWRDPGERMRYVTAIAAALRRGDPAALDAAVRQLDDAVTAGLALLGLPRSPLTTLTLRGQSGGTWLARKDPSCELQFDQQVLYQAVIRMGTIDDLVRTWVHESMHGRRPFAAGHQTEASHWRGYEEGLAEGLARIVTRDIAGMDISEDSFPYYVAVYHALGEAAGVDGELLLRAL